MLPLPLTKQGGLMNEEIRKRAMYGDVSILQDYTDEQLEDELDKFGWNSYHILAQCRKTEILKFNGAYKLRNKSGETAVDILLKNSEINREVLGKMFPWYTPAIDETIEDSVQKIKDTSKAEKFILSL